MKTTSPLFNQTECPSCGGNIVGFPALSRKDNKTNICSDCGTDEAMADYFNSLKVEGSQEHFDRFVAGDR